MNRQIPICRSVCLYAFLIRCTHFLRGVRKLYQNRYLHTTIVVLFQNIIEVSGLIFKGIAKEFSLFNNDQYNTIGKFWDEMSALYGLENLQGLGYKWAGGKIYYAIGLKVGDIPNDNFSMQLPDTGWTVVHGKTDNLQGIYNEIYKSGPLQYEIETFQENGDCQIKYYR